jgi:hypothetical protein
MLGGTFFSIICPIIRSWWRLARLLLDRPASEVLCILNPLCCKVSSGGIESHADQTLLTLPACLDPREDVPRSTGCGRTGTHPLRAGPERRAPSGSGGGVSGRVRRATSGDRWVSRHGATVGWSFLLPRFSDGESRVLAIGMAEARILWKVREARVHIVPSYQLMV